MSYNLPSPQNLGLVNDVEFSTETVLPEFCEASLHNRWAFDGSSVKNRQNANQKVHFLRRIGLYQNWRFFWHLVLCAVLLLQLMMRTPFSQFGGSLWPQSCQPYLNWGFPTPCTILILHHYLLRVLEERRQQTGKWFLNIYQFKVHLPFAHCNFPQCWQNVIIILTSNGNTATRTEN